LISADAGAIQSEGDRNRRLLFITPHWSAVSE
jgi:hypothetical protein